MSEIKIKLQRPSVPNYIRILIPNYPSKQDGWKEYPTIALGDLSDEQLKDLAKEWTEALFENALRQRSEK